MESTITMSFVNGKDRVRIEKSSLEALGNSRHTMMPYNKMQSIIIGEARQRGISLRCVMDIPSEVYANCNYFWYQNKNITPECSENVGAVRYFERYVV